MDDLVLVAAAIFRETGLGDQLRLLGGTAVGLHVGSVARVTHDIDIAAMTQGARTRLLDQLRANGYRIGDAGGWSRAARVDRPGPLIDVVTNPVVSPRTFDAVRLRAAPLRVSRAGVEVVVAGVDDLVSLKLLAARDQDLVDITLLVCSADASPQAIVESAEADDIERVASAGAARMRHALTSGELARIFEELLGRSISETDVTRVGQFLGELERRGL